MSQAAIISLISVGFVVICKKPVVRSQGAATGQGLGLPSGVAKQGRQLMILNLDDAGFGLKFPPTCADREGIKRELIASMVQQMGRDPAFASPQDWFFALAYFLRGRLSSARIRTWRRSLEYGAKWIYYISLEFLPGRLLKTCLLSQGLYETCRQALADFNTDLDILLEFETEAALGNGGLGRLGACLLESIATLQYAGIGYGIRYEYGMFRQKIEGGKQVEHPENWLKYANPWEFNRPNVTYVVHFNGHVTQVNDWRGEMVCHWSDTDDVLATAYDIPVIGYGNDHVGTIRLWSAKATNDFNLSYFNRGNYIEAVEEKSETETLSKVLYPSDSTSIGRILRLKQEYFLVSASLQDILNRFHKRYSSLNQLSETVAIQLNDTHPALAVPELMRILIDHYRLGWDHAWSITVRTIAFTNHTLLAEALETWPTELMQAMLPRHLQIIYEINHRLLRNVTHHHPGNIDLMRRMSLIDETGPRSVRMAHLAVVGSHKVNGVSRMHTEIMRMTIFRDFDDLFPGRIVNVTNGISHRRWLNEANQPLANLISSHISDKWIFDLNYLRELEPFADDEAFQMRFRAAKTVNKKRLALLIKERTGILVDEGSLFDVHVKRIHEYKRQLLNLLHTIARYNRIRYRADGDVPPRTIIFSGKAAPGYDMAKRIIELINFVADIINNDPAVHELLKIVFVPNYDVQTAEDIIPAADLSQQISMAGTEASGTGNMKLALNGALTIATHDGANDEIAEAVGRENIFMFGHTSTMIQDLKRNGYDPAAIYESNAELREVLDMIRNGYFSPMQRDLFVPIFDALVKHGDHYMLLADFEAYLKCQDHIDTVYADQRDWTCKALRNVARVGHFSADRSVREYAATIWQTAPVVEEPKQA